MRKTHQFPVVGSLLILLLLLVLGGAWLRFGGGQSGSTKPQPVFVTPAPGGCRSGWQQMSMDVSKMGFPSNAQITLHGVAALSSQDIWVVGDRLIAHWNGTLWQTTQTQEARQGTWTAITARSATDIWVLGQDQSGPQALHWDGMTWKTTSLPTFTSGLVTLASIAPVASDDVWIAGSLREGDGQSSPYIYQPLTLHWDGLKWQQVAGAALPTGKNASFGGISANSATDIWAVGSIDSMKSYTRELIEHWDGTSWQLVPPPDEKIPYYSINGTGLSSVAAVSATDVWAGGSWNLTGSDANGNGSSMIEHWNGQKWRYILMSRLDSRSDALVSIKALSPTNIWTVGTFVNPNTRLGDIYLQHWDGKAWDPHIPSGYGQLVKNGYVRANDLAITPGGQVIVVGSSSVFTQNPPIDDAAHHASQPFVLASCS